MDDEYLGIVEGLLFISGNEGLELKQIAYALNISLDDAKKLIDRLKSQYGQKCRGISIMQYDESFKITTKKEHISFYNKLIEQPNHTSLSQAALETLAIIAYKQPITKIEIEEIRGVKCDRTIQTLISKLLIKEKGRADSVGRPILYETTKEFLDHFNLKTTKELPPILDSKENIYTQEESDLFFSKLEEITDGK